MKHTDEPVIDDPSNEVVHDPRTEEQRKAVLRGDHYELQLRNGEIIHLYPGCEYDGVDFSGSDLTGVLLVGSVLNNCKFNDCILGWTDFSECSMHNTVFDGAFLDRSNFVNTSLVGSIKTE